MTNINVSDGSSSVDSASLGTSGTSIPSADASNPAFEASSAVVKTGTATVNNIPYAAAIPGSIPGTFTTFGLFTAANSGVSFLAPELTGLLPSTLPFALGGYFGPESGPLSPNYIEDVGWEIKVYDRTYRYMGILPRYTSVAFNVAISNEGAGQVVLDRSDPIFQTTLATGAPGTDLLDYENFWQCSYNGEPIFEFLGTTVEEVIVDASSEAQTITISGAGTARVLKWACSQPPGFPNVVYKLAALTDSFQVPALNPTTWNLTTDAAINAGQVYVDTTTSCAAIVGTPTDYTVSPALAAGYYDATASAVWAQIAPLNMPTQPTNLIANYSFQLGLTGWDTGGSAAQTAGAIANAYTQDSFDGDGWSCQVIASGAHMGIEQTVPALQPKSYYQLNAWIKLPSSSSTMTPTVTLYDSTNSKSGYPGTIASQVGQWVLIQAAILTGNNSNINLICSINSGTAGCTFLVDTCFLYQFTPYTSNAMIMSDGNNPATNFAMVELDMFENNARFWARVFNNGVPTSVLLTTTYDPVQHNYWRIREYAGVFFFDTAPDGATWTNQGQLAYTWSAKDVSIAFTCWYYGAYGATSGFTPMEVGQLNTAGTATVYANGQVPATVNPGSSTNYNLAQGSGVGLSNAYLEVPNAALWLDLLTQSQRRNMIPFVNPTFDNIEDSFGQPWTDIASLIISNGTDLESQLEASVTAFNGDWLMLPNFQLVVGNDGVLGNDLSSTVVFHASGEIQNYTRTRARDQISNYVVAGDGTGNLAYQTSGSSELSWTNRETYIQSSQATDSATLTQMVNAALQEFEYEVSQRTLQVPPDLPGHILFEDYGIGDWVGVQNADLINVDSVRVVGASVSIDGTQDLVTVELTLETRIQLFVERMNVLLQKIGASADAQVISAPGAASQVVLQSSNSTAKNTFTQTIGDNSTIIFFVGHGLGTQSVVVSVRNNSSNVILSQVSGTPSGANQYNLSANSLNQVTLTFASGFAPTGPPTGPGYTVVVKK